MTDALWWARVTANRRKHYDALLVTQVWTLRKGDHEASVSVRRAPGIGSE
jgi:hypothetical protein